jgi:prophage tail gpP-like protein
MQDTWADVLDEATHQGWLVTQHTDGAWIFEAPDGEQIGVAREPENLVQLVGVIAMLTEDGLRWPPAQRLQ